MMETTGDFFVAVVSDDILTSGLLKLGNGAKIIVGIKFSDGFGAATGNSAVGLMTL